MTLSPKDLAEGRRLLYEATPGPWMGGCYWKDAALPDSLRFDISQDPGDVQVGREFSEANADLIVYAVNNLPALLAAAEERRDCAVAYRLAASRATQAEARLAEVEPRLESAHQELYKVNHYNAELHRDLGKAEARLAELEKREELAAQVVAAIEVVRDFPKARDARQSLDLMLSEWHTVPQEAGEPSGPGAWRLRCRQADLTAAQKREEELVERVAEVLYERAMRERRAFSTPEKARGFMKGWTDPPLDDLEAQSRPVSWRDGWRDEAQKALAASQPPEFPKSRAVMDATPKEAYERERPDTQREGEQA